MFGMTGEGRLLHLYLASSTHPLGDYRSPLHAACRCIPRFVRYFSQEAIVMQGQQPNERDHPQDVKKHLHIQYAASFQTCFDRFEHLLEFTGLFSAATATPASSKTRLGLLPASLVQSARIRGLKDRRTASFVWLACMGIAPGE